MKTRLLYNSDLLIYNRASESLWSQVMGQAVSDPRKGERLITVPIYHTTWADWINQHPQKSSQRIHYSVVEMSVHLMVIMMKTVIYFPPCHSAAVCIILKKESLELSSMASLKPIPLWNCHS